MEEQRETRYPNSLLYGFIVLTAILFVAMVYFAYVADNCLTSTTDPTNAIAKFYKNTYYLNLINVVGFFVLLIYANFYYWKKKQGGLLFIVSFLISAVFTNLNYSYLYEAAFSYKKATGLWEGGFSLAPFFGFIITACILALVATNYIITKKLLKEKGTTKEPLNMPPVSPPTPPPNDPS